MDSITNSRFLFTILSLSLLLSGDATRFTVPPVPSPVPSQPWQPFHSFVRFFPFEPIEQADTFLDSKIDSSVMFQANPQVKSICGATDDPELCVSTVVPVLAKKGKINMESVFQASLMVGNELAANAKTLAADFAGTPGTSEALKTTYNDCKDGYDTALENFEKAKISHDANDVGTTTSMLSAVITYLGDCEDQIEPNSPLYKYAEKLTNVTDNLLALNSLMSHE